MIIFDTGGQVGALPSDLDGPTPPPAGSPNYFLTFEVDPARLLQWQFHVDWTTPGEQHVHRARRHPRRRLHLARLRREPTPVRSSARLARRCSRPSTTDLMYRLAYRNFGDHESLVANHTVGTEAGSAAVRWYEIRSPGDAPVVYQQGTYAPDASFRWMGSIAMDGNGNIALGYSKSSAAMYPSIGITGPPRGRSARNDGRRGRLVRRQRQPGGQLEPLGRLQHDVHRSRPTTARSGTRRSTTARPAASTSRPASAPFRFPSCTCGPPGTLEGTVTDGIGPIAGATVTATASGRLDHDDRRCRATTSSSRCRPATYDVTASKFGYVPGYGERRRRHRRRRHACRISSLAGAPIVVVNGRSRTAPARAGRCTRSSSFPARADFPGATLFTDPVTGYYSIAPVAGASYDFAVTAVGAGIRPGRRSAGSVRPPRGAPPAAWSRTGRSRPRRPARAPGYGAGRLRRTARALARVSTPARFPPGWTVDTISGASWKVCHGGDPCGQFDGNRTGGSGPVRDGEQRVLRRLDDGRLLPRHAADRPFGPDERGHPVGQRLHRPSNSAPSPGSTSAPTAARTGRTSGRRRGDLPGPGHADRGHVLRRRPRRTSRRASTTRASGRGGGRSTTSRSEPSPARRFPAASSWARSAMRTPAPA